MAIKILMTPVLAIFLMKFFLVFWKIFVVFQIDGFLWASELI